jgi:hypothetical protein
VNDPELLNQAAYTSGELRTHLCRHQTRATRQLPGVAVAGKRKTRIDKQKQSQTRKTLIRYAKPQQSPLLFPILLRQLCAWMSRPHHPALGFVGNERCYGALAQQ